MVVLSPGFTDRTLELIFSNHVDEAKSLFRREKARVFTDADKRYAVTSDPKFVLPFEHSVVHGFLSGETEEGWFGRFIKRASCNRAIFRSYYDNQYQGTNLERPPKPLVKKPYIKAAVFDLFDYCYGIGKYFSEVDNFRGDNGRISKLNQDQGASFVHVLVDGLSINVMDQEIFSKQVWSQYASNVSPRLFNF